MSRTKAESFVNPLNAEKADGAATRLSEIRATPSMDQQVSTLGFHFEATVTIFVLVSSVLDNIGNVQNCTSGEKKQHNNQYARRIFRSSLELKSC